MLSAYRTVACRVTSLASPDERASSVPVDWLPVHHDFKKNYVCVARIVIWTRMEYKYNGHYYARPCRQTTILTPENIVIKAAQIIWLY